MPSVLLHNFGELANILQSVSILIGIGLFIGALFKIKRYAEMRTMMSHQITLAGPLMMIIAATALIVMPTFISTAVFSVWGTSNPLAYQGGVVEGYEQFIPPILMFARLIGVAAMIRGLVLVSRSGKVGGQPGTTSKALLHLIGGILLIHILGTLHILKTLLDFTGN